jgi:hypothetical protein
MLKRLSAWAGCLLLATAVTSTAAPSALGKTSHRSGHARTHASKHVHKTTRRDVTQPPSAMQALPAFSSSSIWTSRVDGLTTSIDPSSSALVSRLGAMVASEIPNKSGPWINTTQYSVPVYTVPAGQPLVTVTLDKTQPYAMPLKSSFGAGVPIPAGAQAAAGRDQHMVIWQPSSDTMWEFWHMRQLSDGWHADWGGTMRNVSTNPGYFNGTQWSWGASATSLPLVGGLITPAELAAGHIDHALAIALPQTRAKSWTLPAQRTDGFVTASDSIPEGARFRLDPSLDLTSMNLPRLTLILAQAAQRYGIIVRDKSGVVTFYAQDPTPTGTNPYPALFGTPWPSGPLATFPWSKLQLLTTQMKSWG